MKRDILGVTLALVMSLTFIVMLIAIAVKASESNLRQEVETARTVQSNRLDNAHDFVEQRIETSFHEYVVILYKGKVVDRGVLHLANCKCTNGRDPSN